MAKMYLFGGKTMNKTELIAKISEKTYFTKKDCQVCVDTMMDIVVDTLKKGDNVVLAGFGKFEVRDRAARRSFNPATQQPIHLKAKRVPAFKAGKNFKSTIGGAKSPAKK